MPAIVQHLCRKHKVARLGKVCTFENPCESSMKNAIRKPYEGKLHSLSYI